MATSSCPRALSCLAAAMLVFSGCGDDAESAAAQNQFNGFNLSNARVDRSMILRGGPPRDGIPSIDTPRFLAAATVNYLEPEDEVISVSHGGITRAYPLRILVWHEIVNDELAGLPIVVTYCPLCGTAMVFERRVGNRVLTFGVSGLLYQSDVLMYDRETESLWSQLAREAVSGKLAGTRLVWLPAGQMTWAAWRAQHPDGLVLSTETGHQRNYRSQPYANYAARPGLAFPVPERRPELPRKEGVLGLVLEGHARAYPLKDLPDDTVIRETVGGHALELKYDADTRLATVTRAATGEPVPTVRAFWFAWQAFYPETSLWSAE